MQILALIFILKIYFLFIFLDFLISWTGRQILEKAGASAQETRDTEYCYVDCGLNLNKPKDSSLKQAQRKGLIRSGLQNRSSTAWIRSTI
jgi:predicted membrane metal-binding protein